MSAVSTGTRHQRIYLNLNYYSWRHAQCGGGQQALSLDRFYNYNHHIIENKPTIICTDDLSSGPRFCHAAAAGRQASAWRRRRRCAGVSRRRSLRVRGFLFPIDHKTSILSCQFIRVSASAAFVILIVILTTTWCEISATNIRQ